MKKIQNRIRCIYGVKTLLAFLLGVMLYQTAVSERVWFLYFALIIVEMIQFFRVSIPMIKIENTIHDLSRDFDENTENTELELDKKLENVFQWLKEASNREYKMQILRKEAELNELQSQINPHFLYNTLESIRGEALLEDMTEIADMTEALGFFFRYSISRKKSVVTLEEELKNIQYYFLIQKFRFGDHIDMKIEVEDDSVKNYLLPKLTLQPIVENAIYHGLETQVEEGHVEISVGKTDQRLVLVISDDGRGIGEDELEKLNKRLHGNIDLTMQREENLKHGIALDNVNQRIKIRFGNEYGLHVYSTLGMGTDVVVNLPLMEYIEEENVGGMEVNE